MLLRQPYYYEFLMSVFLEIVKEESSLEFQLVLTKQLINMRFLHAFFLSWSLENIDINLCRYAEIALCMLKNIKPLGPAIFKKFKMLRTGIIPDIKITPENTEDYVNSHPKNPTVEK